MTRDEQIQALAAALSSIKGRSPLNEIYAQRLYDEAGVRIGIEQQIEALAAQVRLVEGRRVVAYGEGYADGYARALAGDPPYVEPTAYEDLPELEYGWAGDALAATFYPTQEAAEEFMGSPKRFVRAKAGPWREAPEEETHG